MLLFIHGLSWMTARGSVSRPQCRARGQASRRAFFLALALSPVMSRITAYLHLSQSRSPLSYLRSVFLCSPCSGMLSSSAPPPPLPQDGLGGGGLRAAWVADGGGPRRARLYWINDTTRTWYTYIYVLPRTYTHSCQAQATSQCALMCALNAYHVLVIHVRLVVCTTSLSLK